MRQTLRDWIPFGVALLIAIAITSAAYYFVRQPGNEQPNPFTPLSVTRLDIEPRSVPQEGQITYLNGVCSSAETPIVVEFWVGFQSESSDPLVQSTVIPVIGIADTPEGRERRVLGPGCTGQEPISGTLPTGLEPGLWKLTAHLIARGQNGEIQDLVRSSPVFEVTVE